MEEWERMVDVNLKGVLYGIAAALPHMIGRRCGHINAMNPSRRIDVAKG